MYDCMKKITEAINWSQTVEIGKLTLHPCDDYPDGLKSVWIEQEDGEGGQFPIEPLERLLEKFYNKYF